LDGDRPELGMNHNDALLQAILAAPDDDAPRLAYADWLEEHYQPDRAEFIRIQCDLAKLAVADGRRAELEARERELLAKYESDWLGAIRSPWLRWQFRRGFVEALSHVGFFQSTDTDDSQMRTYLRFDTDGSVARMLSDEVPGLHNTLLSTTPQVGRYTCRHEMLSFNVQGQYDGALSVDSTGFTVSLAMNNGRLGTQHQFLLVPVPWAPVTPSEAHDLETDLRRKLTAGHPLFSVPLRIIWRCGGREHHHVLCSFTDDSGKVAVVYPAYYARNSPWGPATQVFDNIFDWGRTLTD
jgi:uncharacterized protein (TIGR02996 family)